MLILIRRLMIFFFKQKTAYVLRISDWISDVFSSDLQDRADDEVGLGDAFGEVRAVRKARLGARFEEGADAFEHFGIAVEDRDVGAEARRHLRRVEADNAAADDADLARRDAGDAAQEHKIGRAHV